MVAYRQGLDQIDIKFQGLWTSDTFWQYITSSCTATSPLTVGLTCGIYDTTSGMSTTTTSTSSTSSSPHNHRQVTICHSSPPHHSCRHHWFMCSNHALSCCSNHTLSGCSELQPRLVGLQLTSKVNLG